MSKKLLTIGETAELLGLSIDTLRRWEKKGTLLCFRPSPTGNRYYRREDIDEFLKKKSQVFAGDLYDLAQNWIANDPPIELPSSLYCQTSDVFTARLDRLKSELVLIPELEETFSLIIAIVGEIGNNSYNHNIGNWPDIPGTLFGYNVEKRQIIVADRGQGIFKTLNQVLPKLKNDQEALYTAFTEYISGRALENRGNGLKFVRDVVISNPLSLQFNSGDAELVLNEKPLTIKAIKKTDLPFHGCLAIINF